MYNMQLSSMLPVSEATDVLGSSIEVGGVKFQNRLVSQAMEGCDSTFEGRPDNLTKRRYNRIAAGGVGLIWYEATAVLNEGRANPRQLFINENNLDAFKVQLEEIRETAFKANGFAPKIIMQATHSGRYSKPEGTPAPLIAYNNPIFEKEKPIDAGRILSDDNLKYITEALINGARLAQKAGFDGVDIKCCHRYLNSELLSAYNRKGAYGGSFENRTRLLTDAIKGAIAGCSGDFLITTRLNIYDGFSYPYGFGVKRDGSLAFDSTEPILLSKKLESLGVKLINITMGNPYVNPHVNRPFSVGGYTPDEHPLWGVKRLLEGAALIKKSTENMKVVSSGFSFLGAAAPFVAAGYINNGDFDFAGFGRTVFAYPDFARDILKKGELDKDRLCIACSKCSEIMRGGGTPGCVIRDKEVYLPIYKKIVGGK